MIETLANGYSPESTQWVLSYEYPQDLVLMIFMIICFFVHWTKVTSAAKGLSMNALIPSEHLSRDKPADTQAISYNSQGYCIKHTLGSLESIHAVILLLTYTRLEFPSKVFGTINDMS